MGDEALRAVPSYFTCGMGSPLCLLQRGLQESQEFRKIRNVANLQPRLGGCFLPFVLTCIQVYAKIILALGRGGVGVIAGISYGEAKKTLGEQAYESIREEILSLRLYPGQTVYESDFTRMLNMSRTPVREAVRALSMERLIEVLPQRGMKIALISERQVEETRFVRESLEVSAVACLADKSGCPEVRANLEEALRRSLEEQRRCVQQEDAVRFLHADDQFHQVFLQVLGNITLASIVTQMRGHLNRVRMLSLFEPEAMIQLVREHEQIVEAVLSADTDQAARVMRAHLGRLMEDLPIVKARYPDYFDASNGTVR
ncbi:transcriptional regulator, GntR family [Alicyclobacillus hesperidum URH17-3-68]|nr:transcriptional regulator, GntR family [Alicyclobacillus hesperidum URH17-3-68]